MFTELQAIQLLWKLQVFVISSIRLSNDYSVREGGCEKLWLYRQTITNNHVVSKCSHYVE